MADIFISYARSDRPRAQALAEALEELGYSVWWDPKIPPGKTFDDVIEEALNAAKCVVVLWSKESVKSDWVKEEASEGRQRKILVPALIDDVTIPLGFRRIQTADLITWEKDTPHVGFKSLMQAIKEIVGEPLIEEPHDLSIEVDEDQLEHGEKDEKEITPAQDRLGDNGSKEPNGKPIYAIVVSTGLAFLLVVGVLLWISQEKPSKVPMPVAKTGRLYVNTSPEHARVRILNIERKFEQGIELEPGRHHVEVSKEGYDTQKRWIELGENQTKKIHVALAKKTFTNKLGMTFVEVPLGTFMMGSPPDEPGREDDETQHKVTISKPFYLQITEITQDQWKKVMGDSPAKFKNCGKDCPVENVSWADAQDFIGRLNDIEKTDKYRLPTEAEWEYACRAESKTKFFFGNQSGELGKYAWYNANSGKGTKIVGQKRPNAWGIYDMGGNVWEWCNDWYGDYPSKHVTDSEGPAFFRFKRVLRGGSWGSNSGLLRSAQRHKSMPGSRNSYFGFRVARNF